MVLGLIACRDEKHDLQLIKMVSSVEKQTKATVLDNALLGSNGFGVMCYAKENGSFDPINDKPNYAYNLKVYKSGSSWITSTNLYWPESSTDKVSFVAYAPYATADNGITPSSVSHSGYPILNYFASNSDITKQVDLCYAPPVLNKTASDGVINFGFKHALTKITFSAKSHYDYDTIVGYKIKSIKLTNIITKGELFLGTTPTWTPSSSATDTGSYFLTIGNQLKDLKLGLNYQGINNDDAFLMLIPQTFDAINTKLEIVIIDALGTEVKTKQIKLSDIIIGNKFNLGQNLNIRLNVVAGDVYASLVVVAWNSSVYPESTIGKK